MDEFEKKKKTIKDIRNLFRLKQNSVHQDKII